MQLEASSRSAGRHFIHFQHHGLAIIDDKYPDTTFALGSLKVRPYLVSHYSLRHMSLLRPG
jgi:hypothetical protein